MTPAETPELKPRRDGVIRCAALVRHLWRSHCFFVRESRSYAGGWNPRFPTQYPRAWARFMWFSLRDHVTMLNKRSKQ